MGLFSRNKRPLGDYEWNIDEDGTLTITGSGLTSDKSPWCDRSNEVRRLIVKGTGDVVLGKNSFCFGFDNLEEVYLDKNVKRVEESAFMRVSTLRKVEIEGDGLEYLGQYAFFKDEALESIKLGNNIQKIDKFCFTQSGIKEAVLGNDIDTIGEYAFNRCRSLENLVIGNNVKLMDEYCFSDCDNLKTVKIGDNVDKIGRHAFEENKCLEILEIGENCREIGEFGFLNCKGLKTVKIGSGLKILGPMVFRDSKAITYIEIPDSLEKSGISSFPPHLKDSAGRSVKDLSAKGHVWVDDGSGNLIVKD